MNITTRDPKARIKEINEELEVYAEFHNQGELTTTEYESIKAELESEKSQTVDAFSGEVLSAVGKALQYMLNNPQSKEEAELMGMWVSVGKESLEKSITGKKVSSLPSPV